LKRKETTAMSKKKLALIFIVALIILVILLAKLMVRPPPAMRYYLTVKTDPADIVRISGEGWYDKGTYVNLTAPQFVPNATGVDGQRYSFANWTVDGQVSMTLQITVHMDANRTAIAHYVLQYYLSMSTNFGSVAPSSGWHDAGSNVSISASAPALVYPAGQEQYVWNGWTGSGTISYSGKANPSSVIMNSPITETASWTHQYYLTMSTNFGTVSPGSGWQDAGSVLNISATAPGLVYSADKERYVWNGWTGTGSGNYTGRDNPATNKVTMNAPITETASWTHQYYLTVGTNPAGLSPQPVVTPPGSALSGGAWYNNGTDVSLTAPPVTGYIFVYWDVDGTNTTGNPITVHMSTPHTATAHYTQIIMYTLTITTTTGGTTNPSPGTYTHIAGSMVSVTAIPNINYIFNHWELDGVNVGSANPYTVVMNKDYTLKAVFVYSPPVGGYAAPIDIATREEATHLLASQIGLAFALLAAMGVTILLTKRRSKTLK
jgi:hypothetical protein